MEQEVLEKLIKKLSDISGIDISKINANTKLKEDLKVSSMEISKVISEFEDEYDTYIKYTELMHAVTVGDAAKEIAKFCE